MSKYRSIDCWPFACKSTPVSPFGPTPCLSWSTRCCSPRSSARLWRSARAPSFAAASPARLRRALRHGKINSTDLHKAVVAAEPDEAFTVGGYAVYPLDTTIAPRPDAPTVKDRSKVYSSEVGKAVPAHQFSWLGRSLTFGQSWFAPRDVERVPASSTPCAVGAMQVKRLIDDPTPSGPKVVVADSRYAQPTFLRSFIGLAGSMVSLVRLANNRVLYGSPPPPTRLRRVAPVFTGRSWPCALPARPSARKPCLSCAGRYA